MIIHIASDAPLLVRAAAASALALHIGGGVAAIGAGGVAMAARKGGWLHRRSGDVFALGMIVSMAVAAVTAPMIGQPGNTFGALLNIYLVATAWTTVRRGARGPDVLDFAGVVAPTAAALAFFAWRAAESGLAHVTPYLTAAAMSGLCVWGAWADLKVIRAGGLSGSRRLVRHVWRMSLALFAAAGSFFIGQPQVFPPPLRGSPILFLPVVAIAVATVVWLVRLNRGRGLSRVLVRSPA